MYSCKKNFSLNPRGTTVFYDLSEEHDVTKMYGYHTFVFFFHANTHTHKDTHTHIYISFHKIICVPV